MSLYFGTDRYNFIIIVQRVERITTQWSCVLPINFITHTCHCIELKWMNVNDLVVTLMYNVLDRTYRAAHIEGERERERERDRERRNIIYTHARTARTLDALENDCSKGLAVFRIQSYCRQRSIDRSAGIAAQVRAAAVFGRTERSISSPRCEPPRFVGTARRDWRRKGREEKEREREGEREPTTHRTIVVGRRGWTNSLGGIVTRNSAGMHRHIRPTASTKVSSLTDVRAITIG